MNATEKTQESKAESMMQLATVVSERVDIEDIRLVETTARFFGTDQEFPDQVHTFVSREARAEAKDNRIRVFLTFRLRAEATRNEDEPNRDFLRIDAVFALTYSVSTLEGLSKENLSAFGELNGTFNAWPYWRELVQNFTVRMGLPGLTIPALKVGQRESTSRPRPRKASKAKAR